MPLAVPAAIRSARSNRCAPPSAARWDSAQTRYRQAPRCLSTAIRSGQSRWKSNRASGRVSMRSAAYRATSARSASSGIVRMSRPICPDRATSWHGRPALSVPSRIRRAACRPTRPLSRAAASSTVLPSGSSNLPPMLNWLPLSCMSCKIAFWPQVNGWVPASAPANWTTTRSWLAGSNIADSGQLLAPGVNPLAGQRRRGQAVRPRRRAARVPARGWLRLPCSLCEE